MLRLTTPWFLLLFIPLALVVLRPLFGKKGKARPGLAVPDAGPLITGRRGLWARLAPVERALRPVALALIILAMTGPQQGTSETTVISEGVDIIMAVDLSHSMAALDFRMQGQVVNRLQAVQAKATEFIQGREGDRIGLVVFGAQAYTQMPLNRDYDAIIDILNRLEIGSAGGNTALGDGLGISLKRLAEVKGESRVVILLTDGVSNTGALTPMQAAEIAARAGVRIYCVGVGGKKPAKAVYFDAFGHRKTTIISDTLDEKTLTAVAEKTGGMFFRAEDSQGLENIYETIDRLEKSRAEVMVYAEYRDLYPWLALPALGLLMLWAGLANTRMMRLP